MTDELDDLMMTDPYRQAEKLTGRSYKNDALTSNLALLFHMDHTQKLRGELEARDDTHYSSTFMDALRVYGELGFEVIYQKDHQGRVAVDKHVILWRDGILAAIDSYSWSEDKEPTVNTNTMWYNWQELQENRPWTLTGSGHYSKAGLDRGDRIWVGDKDMRIGLRHTLAGLEEYGRFLPEWEERPFLWLLHYGQTQNDDVDYKRINEEVIAEFPQYVQDAIGAPND